MPDSVLVAVDGSPPSERALVYALETFPDAAVTALHVIDPADSVLDAEADGLSVADDWYERAEARAARTHEAAVALAAERDTDLETVTEVGRPARVVLEYADEHGMDGIVVGTRGRSKLDRMLLGSVAERVTRRARVPVTVVR